MNNNLVFNSINATNLNVPYVRVAKYAKANSSDTPAYLLDHPNCLRAYKVATL